MSKKPLLSEGTARRWAKYAGIQNESKALIEGMYSEKPKMEEEALEEELEENLEEDAHVKEEALEEADVLAELEEMLDEGAHEDEEGEEAAEEEAEDEKEDEEEDELDAEEDKDEEEMDMADAEEDEAMMSQSDVEAAVKSALEAMANALGDALKVKIDVRAGDDDMEMDAEEEVMEMAGMDPSMEEGHGMGKMPHGGMEEEMDPRKMVAEEEMEEEMYEGLDRDELVEAVMKRVVARLVKETKED